MHENRIEHFRIIVFQLESISPWEPIAQKRRKYQFDLKFSPLSEFFFLIYGFYSKTLKTFSQKLLDQRNYTENMKCSLETLPPPF